MKILLAAALSLSSYTSIASAVNKYDLVINDGSGVIYQKNWNSNLTLWDVLPTPNCSEITAELSRLKRSFSRCVRDQEDGKPINFRCEILKESMNEIIWGTTDPLSGFFAEDVEHYWTLNNVSLEQPSQEEINELLSKVDILEENVHIIEDYDSLNITVFEDYQMQLADTSDVKLLNESGFFDVALGEIYLATDNSFVTSDRLSYCELASGQASISSKVKFDYQIDTQVPEDLINSLYEVYLIIHDKYKERSLSSYDLVLLGYDLANALESLGGTALLEEISLYRIVKAFISNKDERAYLNDFSKKDDLNKLFRSKIDFNLTSSVTAMQ